MSIEASVTRQILLRMIEEERQYHSQPEDIRKKLHDVVEAAFEDGALGSVEYNEIVDEIELRSSPPASGQLSRLRLYCIDYMPSSVTHDMLRLIDEEQNSTLNRLRACIAEGLLAGEIANAAFTRMNEMLNNAPNTLSLEFLNELNEYLLSNNGVLNDGTAHVFDVKMFDIIEPRVVELEGTLESTPLPELFLNILTKRVNNETENLSDRVYTGLHARISEIRPAASREQLSELISYVRQCFGVTGTFQADLIALIRAEQARMRGSR